MAHSDLIAQISAQHGSLYDSLSAERDALRLARQETEKAFDDLHLQVERLALAELGKHDALMVRIDHLLKTLGPPANGAALDAKLPRPANALRLNHQTKPEHRT